MNAQLHDERMIHGAWPRWLEPARIEHETPLVPSAVAIGVWGEVNAWLGLDLPREWLSKLVERAEAVYASNARVRRRLRGPGDAGRDWLWTFMRHWLAALIKRHRPGLYTRLPSGFGIGQPLPPKPVGRPRGIVPTGRQARERHRPIEEGRLTALSLPKSCLSKPRRSF